MTGRVPARNLFHRKSIESLVAQTERRGLKRVLSGLDLVMFGVGGIVGSGVYVMTGAAAARYAGPGVMISLLIAGVACVLIAFCYAELAAAAPTAGAAYTYSYATLGEVFAWIVGWLVLMDFGLAGSSLAVAWSAYLRSLLHSLGVDIPAALSTPTFHALPGSDAIVGGHSVNVVAALAYVATMLVLAAGIAQSKKANAILVVIKVAVLTLFIVVGARAIQPLNWQPLVPANEGGFAYGWQGILRGASMLFFAYLGFEVVANAASETRDPKRDMPVGIIGSLGACMVIYLLVAAVLTGIVPFRQLGGADALAMAADRIGHPGLAVLVKFGALVGISSVLLVNAYGQSRLAFTISVDGLLPRFFSRLHERRRTPHLGIFFLGSVSAVMAATLPLSLLTDMVSLGVNFCFSVVAISVMWLRTYRPDLPRPFKVPLGGFRIGGFWIGLVPLAAIILSWTMMLPVIVDLIEKAQRGDAFPVVFMSGYFSAGAIIYLTYGRRRGRIGNSSEAAEAV